MDWKYLFLSFEGRINRKLFWIGLAVLFVVNIVASVLDMVVGAGGLLSSIISLVMIYPSLAVSAKRWHDRNKSAWWILINLIPVIGWIWSIVETGFLAGTAGANRFGPDPLSEEGAGVVRTRRTGNDSHAYDGMLRDNDPLSSDSAGGSD